MVGLAATAPTIRRPTRSVATVGVLVLGASPKNVMLVRLLQDMKGSLPKLVTLSGIVILVRLAQFWKA